MTAPLVWHSARTLMTSSEVYLNSEARHGYRTLRAAMDADRQVLLENNLGMKHMRALGQLWSRVAEGRKQVWS